MAYSYSVNWASCFRKNLKQPIERILRKHYAHTGEYLLAVADESPAIFYDWFDLPRVQQSFIRLNVSVGKDAVKDE